MKTKTKASAAEPASQPKAEAKKKQPSWPVFTQRFGKTVRQAGVSILPRVLLTNLGTLKITPIQGMILVQLIACWGKTGKHPFPGRKRLREWLGCNKRTLDRAITGLVKLGLVERRKRSDSKSRRQTTNEYDLTGLIERLKPLARKAITQRQHYEERRKAADAI